MDSEKPAVSPTPKRKLVYLEGTKLYYENGVYMGEVFALDDGFQHFWPESKSCHGAWSAHALRAIADLLDEMNAPWEKELIEAFSKIKETADEQ